MIYFRKKADFFSKSSGIFSDLEFPSFKFSRTLASTRRDASDVFLYEITSHKDRLSPQVTQAVWFATWLLPAGTLCRFPLLG